MRVGQAHFDRRPTIRQHRELLVGRRGEAPLVPPYILPCFKKALHVSSTCRFLHVTDPHASIGPGLFGVLETSAVFDTRPVR